MNKMTAPHSENAARADPKEVKIKLKLSQVIILAIRWKNPTPWSLKKEGEAVQKEPKIKPILLSVGLLSSSRLSKNSLKWSTFP